MCFCDCSLTVSFNCKSIKITVWPTTTNFSQEEITIVSCFCLVACVNDAVFVVDGASCVNDAVQLLIAWPDHKSF